MKLETKFVCPHCKQELQINTYPVINLQTDKELYNDLFSLNLFKINCPNCKKTTVIQYDCLVVDMFKKYIVYLYISNNLDEFNKNIDKLVESHKNIISELKHTRVVTSLNQLLEKMLIFDYDLNDKIIEIMKLGMYNKERLDSEIYKNICFNKIEKDKLIFTCFNINDNKVQPIDISVDIKYYNIIIDSIGGSAPDETSNFEYIDANWAKNNIKNEK